MIMTYPYREIEQKEPSLPEPEKEKPLPWYTMVILIVLMMVIGYVALRMLFTVTPR